MINMSKLPNFKKYFFDFQNLINFDKKNLDEINNLYLEIKNLKKNNKILIFGNGGSSAIASHFANDLSNIVKIKCLNFSDSSLITCLSNDYGYENWITRVLKLYATNGDLVILISSSGMSKNMINAAKFIKKNKIKLACLTGFSSNNKLKKIGDISIWIKSEKYNYIENAHQVILLAIVDAFLK
jgi:D-sedoheptulose 7-phosphate isomerase